MVQEKALSFLSEVTHQMKWQIAILSLSKPYRNTSLEAENVCYNLLSKEDIICAPAVF